MKANVLRSRKAVKNYRLSIIDYRKIDFSDITNNLYGYVYQMKAIIIPNDN